MLNGRLLAASAALILSLTTFASPVTAGRLFADSSNSALCGEQGAEGYKRPGGFCDQLDDNSSLVKDLDDDDCTVVVAMNGGSRETGRLLASMPLLDSCGNPICPTSMILPHEPIVGILRVAC